jgi:hypothetical protein
MQIDVKWLQFPPLLSVALEISIAAHVFKQKHVYGKHYTSFG